MPEMEINFDENGNAHCIPKQDIKGPYINLNDIVDIKIEDDNGRKKLNFILKDGTSITNKYGENGNCIWQTNRNEGDVESVIDSNYRLIIITDH